MLTRITVAALCAFVSGAAAQTPSWSGPVLGYVFDDSEKAVKIIGGIPGAASVEASLPSAAKLERAHIAPGRRFAIVETVGGESLAVLDWSEGGAHIREVSGALASASSVAFSPAGDVAAVARKSAGVVQIWGGLPSEPHVRREVAVDGDALAVSSSGSVAALSADGLLSLDGDSPRLLVPGAFAALAFRPGSLDLAVSPRGKNEVSLVRGFEAEAAVETLAGSAEGIDDPVALQFSFDGTTLAVANGRGRSATLVDVGTRSAATTDCGCTPSAVSAVGGRAVFRITGPEDGPMVFIDADAPGARTFLVPGGAR